MLLARTLINLSTVQLKIEELDVAQMNLIRALSISKNYSEGNSVSLSAMQNLAALFTQRGNFIEAEEIYLNLINIRKKYKVSSPSIFASTLNNLALLYKKNCRYESALPYLSDAIEIWNSIKFNNYKNLAYSYYNQGELYKSLGKYELSVQSFKKGIGLLSKNKELYYDLYIEQNYGLINLYLKFGKINLAKILIKNINLDRKTRGLNIIFIEKIPEEVYEDCSTFKT